MQQHQLSNSNKNDSLLKSIRPIYEASFPVDERRDFEDLLSIAESEDFFHADIYVENDETIGFITYWHFPEFIYIEHFAVHENTRGKGFGNIILTNLLENSALPIILEVEKPENETSRRRIRFYENMGFTLCEKPYIQPAYAPEKNSLSLFLMHYGDIDMNISFEHVKNTLYKHVYKYNPH